MAVNQVAAPEKASNLSSNVIRVLAHPWLDRTIAAVACVPLVYGSYYRYTHSHQGLPVIASVLNILILVVTMVIRRPPKRVTPNPWYWLLAFVATNNRWQMSSQNGSRLCTYEPGAGSERLWSRPRDPT
jgi:hypothetical protein